MTSMSQHDIDASEWSAFYSFLTESSPPSSPTSGSLSPSESVDAALPADQDEITTALQTAFGALSTAAETKRSSSGDDALDACEWSAFYRFLSELSPPSSPRSQTSGSRSSSCEASVLISALSKHASRAASPNKKWASKLSHLLRKFRSNERTQTETTVKIGCFPKIWSAPPPKEVIITEEDRITEANTTANLANLIPSAPASDLEEAWGKRTSSSANAPAPVGRKSSFKRNASSGDPAFVGSPSAPPDDSLSKSGASTLTSTPDNSLR